MHISVIYKAVKLVQLLLTHGADPNAKNDVSIIILSFTLSLTAKLVWSGAIACECDRSLADDCTNADKSQSGS